MPNELDDEIRHSKVIVRSGRYAYLKLAEMPDPFRFFFVSQDEDEITAIAEEKTIAEVDYLKVEKWFKAFEIRCATPFLVKGFLAKIASAIAEQGLNILLVSTFSKDYAFIREEDTEIAIKALRNVGFSVIETE
jgi:hypothetical protein